VDREDATTGAIVEGAKNRSASHPSLRRLHQGGRRKVQQAIRRLRRDRPLALGVLALRILGHGILALRILANGRPVMILVLVSPIRKQNSASPKSLPRVKVVPLPSRAGRAMRPATRVPGPHRLAIEASNDRVLVNGA
jgi:hypothetical protein